MNRYRILKRNLDIIFGVCFLLAFWWVYLIAWIGIKLSSPGDVIYRARRIGINGQIFDCYKFRSMRMDSGKVRLTTLANDERIFPFGKFMRVTKIDEMPQIFNILKGEMSVVGPRPEDVENASQMYTGEFRNILSVKPGLTSPASLYDYTHGELYTDISKYEKVIVPQKLRLDLDYVQKLSFVRDTEIVIKTAVIIVAKVFGKKDFKMPKLLESGEMI